MKIGVLPAYAIRAYKQVVELKQKGIEVLGMTDRTTSFNTAYDQFLLYCREPSLCRIFEGVKSMIDLMVCFHEPAWMGIIAKDMGYKLVVDVGDLHGLRTGKPTALEVNLIKKADGLVYNSVSYRDYIRNTLKLDATNNEAVVPPYANKAHYCSPRTSKGGIVYQGSIMPPHLNGNFMYRNMEPITEAFQDLSIDFHIYPSPHFTENAQYYIKKYNPSTVNTFISLGADDYENPIPREQNIFIYNSLSYRTLVDIMGDYHWGFMGTPIPNSYLEVVMPHKIFDYLAAGIPMIALNMGVAGKFIEKEGIGIAIKDVSEIPDIYDEWSDIQKNVLAVRDKWAMENFIDEVVNVYETAVKGGK